jgi:PAS domain S-box-containing protein
LARVREALDGNLLQMAYQPIVDLRSGHTRGAEALARFQSTPYRTPDIWFAEAAAVGLGVDLELKAVRAALMGLAAMPVDTYLAINVSPSTLLDPRLFEEVRPYAGARVLVELTEHARVVDYGPLCEAISRLRSLHVRLAVDDAGAGFSSFQHILSLRPDVIKLDRSLTTGVDGNPVRLALASAMVTFASSLGAKICAEGIETVGDLVALQKLGVSLGQGYFFARPAALPLPPIAVGAWMTEARPRSSRKTAPELFRTQNGLDKTALDAYLASAKALASAPAQTAPKTKPMESPFEADFDAITELAASLLEAPIALVSLLDEQPQLFKSSYGLPRDGRESQISAALCRHAISHEAPLLLSDARSHALVMDSPAARDLGIVAYIGVPLISEDNRTRGALCAVDTKARDWSEKHVSALQQIARAVTGLLDLHAAIGRSTSRELLLEELFKQSPAAMFVCDITGRIVRCNQRFLEILGHEEGDLLSQHIGTIKHPHDAARDFAMRDDLLAGRTQRPKIQTRYKRKDGSWCNVEVEFSVMRGDASSALFTIGALREI